MQDVAESDRSFALVYPKVTLRIMTAAEATAEEETANIPVRGRLRTSPSL